MDDRWTTSLVAPPGMAVRFGAAWLLLNALPLLPAVVSPLPQSPYAPLCVEVLVLVTGLVYASGTQWEGAARVGALGGTLLLVVYQAYDAVVYAATRRTGILYEDLQLADNLTYFALDTGAWRLAGGALLAAVAGGGVVWAVHRALRAVARGGRYGASRAAVVAVHLVAWPLVAVVGPAQDWGTPNLTYQTGRDQVRMRTVATKAWGNARASWRLHALLDSLGTAPVDSTYHSYDALSLTRRPSVYMLAIESYGSVLDRQPALRGPYRRVMRRTEDTLRTHGWHMASTRLQSPVRGGRSWLAIASLLTGVRVDRQALFTRFQNAPGAPPHLVRFFNRQGYHTVALQPFTFERPGLPVRNLYDFDVTLYRDDLDYSGPSYGLADAPDQYSLHFAHHTELAPSTTPFFLFFETVSSHALWNYGLPPYLTNWQQFNTGSGPTWTRKARLDSLGTAPTPFLPDSITAPRPRTLSGQPTPRRYLQHIAYDLTVMRDYIIRKAPEGSLVLLLGDHQPPLLDTTTDTVPLHVMSTDAALVDRVRRYGLTDGLIPADTSATLRQEGLYSLLVRLLAAPDGGASDSTALPPYRPEGIPPSVLVR